MKNASVSQQSSSTNAPSGEGAVAPHVYARLYGEPMTELPPGLYIPPDALEIILERFEGPLDLLLWLIRSQKFDIMDIPMAKLTEQYMAYVELIRRSNLELASAYLVMSATLMSIKSRMLLPRSRDADPEEEPEDPRAELMRRLVEYERIRTLATLLADLPRIGRDFLVANCSGAVADDEEQPPMLTAEDIGVAWEAVEEQMSLVEHHRVTREELSVREHMTLVLKALQGHAFLRFTDLLEPGCTREQLSVWLLASLELGKEFLINLQQAVPYGEIYLRAEEGPLLVPEGEGPGGTNDNEVSSTETSTEVFDEPEGASKDVVEDVDEAPLPEDMPDEELEAAWKQFFNDPGRRGSQGNLF